MKKVTLPDGTVGYLTHATDEEAREYEAFMQARHRFVQAYVKEKGWPSEIPELSIEQIMEIRNQPGWKIPEGVKYQQIAVAFVPVERLN